MKPTVNVFLIGFAFSFFVAGLIAAVLGFTIKDTLIGEIVACLFLFVGGWCVYTYRKRNRRQ